ncbi:MAG: ATP-binding protein [Chlamydiales bacterium]|nr:ATP-binding protein [Chlamydiales bacterium]
MIDKHFDREAESLLKAAASQFPAVLVTGPRQAGKTTLLRQHFPNYSWACLDDLEVRGTAIRDPEFFFSQFPPPVVIDEIQYAPELLSYIKQRIDQARRIPGQYILTGSQTFQIMEGVSESLAGRIGIFDLYPLTWKEILNNKPLPRGSEGDQQLFQTLTRGFYPELHALADSNCDFWMRSYLRTYIERDVRDIKAIANLHDFQRFLKLLAPRAGQLLNLSEVNKEAGIAHSTAREWLSILESTFIIKLVQPYHNNHTKRLVKTPKLYFVDTGLLCHLLNIRATDQLIGSPFEGQIFENMVMMEVIKGLEYTLSPLEIFFYRNLAKQEVDLILKSAKNLAAYEIKFTKSPKQSMCEGLKAFHQDFPQAQLHLVSLSEKGLGFPKIASLHWSELLNHLPN